MAEPMMPLATMTMEVVKVYYLVFAVATIIGGIIGFLRAKSPASLIAGAVSAGVLAWASFMLPEPHPIQAYVAALLVSALLAGKFVPDFVHKKAVVPGGLMAVLSIAGIVLTLVAWYGH